MAHAYLDWFEPALHSQVTLSAALDRVICVEESKLQFSRCLKQALCNTVPNAPDRISAVAEDIKLLQKTFQLRLGILAIDRPQAWFRHSSAAERGPFPVAMYEEPVFARFEESRAVAVKKALPELWRKRLTACAEYDPAVSLWGRLLLLNRRLEQINQLPQPFADLRLEELPEALPDALLSPALNKFTSMVALKMRATQKELDECYELLWSRSESFLYALHLNYLSGRARQGARHGQSERPVAPNPLGEAMNFMNFGSLPSFDDLRQRYRYMAHTMHPDRGGSEDRFKLLSQHYRRLLEHLERS